MFGKLYHFLCIFNHQWWSIEKLNRHQSICLRKAVKLAYKNVPFYENLYNRSNIKPDIINSIQDIHQLPIINRKMVKDAGINIISKQYNISKLNSEKTSGSTGRPLTIYRSQSAENLILGSKFRTYLATGYNPFYRTAIWSWEKRSGKRLSNLFCINRELTMLRHISIQLNVASLKKYQPDVYSVNISSLNEIMQFIKKHPEYTPLTPKLIYMKNENLFPIMRKKVQDYFKINPIDIYGAMEFGYIAWECTKREGLHINADQFFVEILDPKSLRRVEEGKIGKVIITDFCNPAFPLLRYDTGDYAVYTKKPCSCGRIFPLIKAIQGRESDMLTLPSGTEIYFPYFLIGELKWYMEIEQYQAIYTKNKELIIKLKMEYGKFVNEGKIISSIRKRCENIPVKIEYVDGFEKSKSGKFCTFISESS